MTFPVATWEKSQPVHGVSGLLLYAPLAEWARRIP